jgi:hypothetical protein
VTNPKKKNNVKPIIVHPEKDVKLQGIAVEGLTDAALELNVRIDRELKEVSINKIK